MYAQTAIKQNPIRRNGATDIVMRGVHRYGIEKDCRYVVSN